MAKIKNVKGRQVFDSRGNPTVEAEVFWKTVFLQQQYHHREPQQVHLKLMS